MRKTLQPNKKWYLRSQRIRKKHLKQTLILKNILRKLRVVQKFGTILRKPVLWAKKKQFKNKLQKRFRSYSYFFRKTWLKQKLLYSAPIRRAIKKKTGKVRSCFYANFGRSKNAIFLKNHHIIQAFLKKSSCILLRKQKVNFNTRWIQRLRFVKKIRFTVIYRKRFRRKRRWRVHPKKTRKLRKKKRFKIFFSRKYFFKRISARFFIKPFINWQFKFAKKSKKIKQYWKIIDLSLRKFYFYNIQPKESFGFWSYNQAGRFNKILAFRQALCLRLDNLLVLAKFVPNLRTATLLIQRRLVCANEEVVLKHHSVSNSDMFYVLPQIIHSLVKWSIFTRQALRYRKWRLRSWRRLNTHPLISRGKHLNYIKSTLRPWVFRTEEGSSYSAIQLLKVTSNKFDLWFKMNPWIWNLSFFPVPAFLEISSKVLLGVICRWPYSYEIVPWSRFSDKVMRRYVRKFINSKPLRPKKYEVWTKFRIKLRG